MERILGLDLGVNSVGWALVTWQDGSDIPDIRAGAYVFPEGFNEERDGTLVSSRSERGQKRRMRKQLRRKRQRRRKVLHLLVSHGLLPRDPIEREKLMSSDRVGGERPFQPYVLRKKGLDERLTLHEFGRCIYHLAKRRGYLSTRDLIARFCGADQGRKVRDEALRSSVDQVDALELSEKELRERKETSKLLAHLARVRSMVEQGQARTIGELCANMLLDPTNRDGVRASGKRKKGREQKEKPGWRAERFLYEEEFDILWKKQAQFYPTVLTRKLRDELRHAVFYQRPLMSKKGLVGPCEFLRDRKRLPRATLLAQRCAILQTLTNLRLSPTAGLPYRPLTGEEVCALADELDRRSAITWDEARRIIGAASDARFSEEPATAQARRSAGRSARSREALRGNRTASAMRAALGDERWDEFTPHEQEEIVDRLVYAHYPHNAIRGLVRDFGLTRDEARALAGAELPEGYTNHCRKVWKALEPLMRAGMNYYDACVAAGFRRPNESTVKPPEEIVDRLGGLPDLRNPVVQRSAKMAFRVINAVIDRFGKPDRIRIEMPADVSRTNRQREEVWRAQDERYRQRLAAAKLLLEHNLPLGDGDRNVRKVLLWEEAGRRCPYEPDKEVSLQELIDHYTIEHIIPRSRDPDSSWMNLTICPMGLNLEKGDRTPYECWGQTERWKEIERYVSRTQSIPRPKRLLLLSQETDFSEFTQRHLTNTRYVARVVAQEVRKLGVPVEVGRGALTAELRRVWQLEGLLPDPPPAETEENAGRAPRRRRGKSRIDHRHHALDAIVTAFVGPAALQRLTLWYRHRELGGRREESPLPAPFPGMRDQIQRLLDEMAVVHAPRRSVYGPLHGETALPPPPREEVEKALAEAPPLRGRRPRKAVIVGGKLVRIRPDGTPFAAYSLGSNHHVVIWERICSGKTALAERTCTVVSMAEAARRAVCCRPVIDTTPPSEDWRYVMALCKGDLVEWVGERPGLYRVAQFTQGDGFMEIRLRPAVEARANKETHIRVRSGRDLSRMTARVCLDPLGFEIAREG